MSVSSDDISDLVVLVAQVLSKGTELQSPKSDYPDKSKVEVFSKTAEKAISKPASIAEKLSSAPKREALDKEFWETF